MLAGMLMYLPWLGSYGLLDPTDSFFLESGRELVETNQYLLPMNNYEPWLDKPILFFWLVAAAYKCGGINVFIGRLPAALSAILAAVLIYTGSRPVLKPNTAFLAAIVFLTIPLCSIVGHVCLVDMTLTALIAGAVLYLFKGLEYQNKFSLTTGYFSLALAMLCKGPIAIVICGLAFLPYLISLSRSRKNFLQLLISLNPLLGAAIVMAFNVPWYVLASLATHGEFIKAFFFTQNFGRMVGTVNHQEPIYFYIPVFLGAFFPWWPLIFSNPQTIKSSFADRSDESNKESRYFWLNLCCFIGVISLFTIIKTKLPTYILPCAPSFAILTAIQLEKLSDARKLHNWLPTAVFLSVALVAVFTLQLALAKVIVIQPISKGYIHQIAAQNIWILAPLAISVIASWFAIMRRSNKLLAVSLIGFALLICVITIPQGLKTFYEKKQQDFNLLATRARDDKASVAMIFAEEPSVPWFTHRAVSRLSTSADAEKFLSKTPAPHYVLVQSSNMQRMDWFSSPTKLIAETDKWHLIQITK